MFVGKDNAVKVGRLKTFLRFAYPHDGPWSWIDVEVRFFVIKPKPSCRPQLSGGYKPRAACSEKLNKPFHFRSSYGSLHCKKP